MASNAQALAQSGGLDAVLEARGFAYGLLARAFLAEPAPDLVRSLAQSDLASLFPYAEQPGLIAQGVAEVAAYLADPAAGSAEGFDRLLWDYTRLFIGPAKLPAPPYESVYRSPDRLLFQEETLAVRKAFRAYGLETARAGSEPDDHIGLELQFLAETCRVAAEAGVAGVDQVLRDQAAFLDEHLLQWAADFAADVTRSAETGFYRGMAQLLMGFLPVDRRLLDELLQDA